MPYVVYAAHRNDVHIVKALLRCGASLAKRDESGRTALLAACWANNVHIADKGSTLETILGCADGRATINVPNRSGNVPLHYATQHCNVRMMRMLLLSGADPNVRNGSGATASAVVASTRDRNAWGLKNEDFSILKCLELLRWAQEEPFVVTTGKQRLDECLRRRTHVVSLVMMLKEWRPSHHRVYPLCYSSAVETVLVLARSVELGGNADMRTAGYRTGKYEDVSCLALLPNEILHIVFAYITAPPGWC